MVEPEERLSNPSPRACLLYTSLGFMHCFILIHFFMFYYFQSGIYFL